MSWIDVMGLAKALCHDDGRDWGSLSQWAKDAYYEDARAAVTMGVPPPSRALPTKGVEAKRWDT